ncbi:hypothetical protein E4U42_002242 [Claviceps africana]|uniref:cyclin-dependent kinase n=1 Tax=Claviceps africana TaxID=83212 RepID=A0A8K0JD72_9HYPO|nr:hypothetical protein E4U42_002242 [Claviceps africana]
MSSSSAWKASLSTFDRYTIIQHLQASLPADKRNDAVAIEQHAFQHSSSRNEYDAAVRDAASSVSPSTALTSDDSPDTTTTAHTGITIGSYSDCEPVAEGVTSTVYHSGAHALKVITASGNLEPHNPQREASILAELHALEPPPDHIVRLVTTFRDEQSRRVLVFPYHALTLDALLSQGPSLLPTTSDVARIFQDILRALAFLHKHDILHRDVKPSAILLDSPSGPAVVSDFGTAWHPRLSAHTEPPSNKILDIGTGPYRAPEVLFANKAYGPPVDMWATGVMLAEAITRPPRPPFESEPAHQDGNQLGLILSIIKTLGTPTEETWPEAKAFKVSPFELWTVFPHRGWEDILPHVHAPFRHLVARLLRFESGERMTAEEASSATVPFGPITHATSTALD